MFIKSKNKQFTGQSKLLRRKLNKTKFKRRKNGQQIFKKAQQQNDEIGKVDEEEQKHEFSNKKHLKKLKDHQGQKIKPLIEHITSEKWYDYQFDEICQIKDEKNDEKKLQEDNLVQRVQKRADNLLLKDTEKFMQWYRSRNHGDADWLETIEHKGTFSDRITALQLSIHKSPIHAIQHLTKFVAFVEKKGAKIRQAYSITKTLKDLYLNELLPPERKLVPFNHRPLEKWANEKGPEAEKRLILWNFEAKLKENYHQFLLALEALGGNAIEAVAQTACREMTELLIERPEQEQFLLSAIVNKLGHPQHRVGAKVAQMLEQLVQKHPKMRPFVAKEVGILIFRKNISPRAQRYGLHFLSRMIFDAGEFELALQLIQIYLRLFRILILNDKLNEHRLLPLLVAGLNRAFPYAKGKAMESDLLSDMDSFYAILQTAKFSTAINVLRLIFQIHSYSEGLSDRFYCAYYRRLLNLPTNGNSEQMKPFFELTQKVLKNDLVQSRVRAFLKRLFQIALTSNSAFAAATLLTCYSVVKEKPQLLRLDVALTEKICGDEPKQFESENKSKKNKKKGKKNKEELPSEEIDEEREKQQKLELKLKWFEENEEDSDVEEECYNDVKLESDEEEDEKLDKKREQKIGWIHRRLKNGAIQKIATPPHINGQKPKQTAMRKNNVYDPNGRNPLFAGTDFALDTELYTLARHYHPTVAMFARALIKGEPIHYEGDPLIDHSHMRFLDRYAFKNPKTRHKKLSEVGKAAERQNFDDDDDDHEDDDDKSEEEEEEYEFD